MSIKNSVGKNNMVFASDNLKPGIMTIFIMNAHNVLFSFDYLPE